MPSMEHIIRNLQNTVDIRQAQFNDWVELVKVNPLHELSWSNRMFINAAELKIAAYILPFLKGEVNPDFVGDRIAVVIEEIEIKVLDMAQRLEHSTSPTSNLAANCERVEWTKMLRWLKRVRPQ